MSESKEIYRAHVDKKLIIRQRIFLCIITILLAINAVNVFERNIGVRLAVAGFLISTMVGLLLSRIFKIVWNEKKAKVVSRLDTVGTILLALYLLFEFQRNWILGHFVSANILTAFSIIILSGLLLGRFLGTLIKIKEVLAEK